MVSVAAAIKDMSRELGQQWQTKCETKCNSQTFDRPSIRNYNYSKAFVPHLLIGLPLLLRVCAVRLELDSIVYFYLFQ